MQKDQILNIAELIKQADMVMLVMKGTKAALGEDMQVVLIDALTYYAHQKDQHSNLVPE